MNASQIIDQIIADHGQTTQCMFALTGALKVLVSLQTSHVIAGDHAAASALNAGIDAGHQALLDIAAKRVAA